MNLSQVQKLALALPEVAEEPHFHRTSFEVMAMGAERSEQLYLAAA